MELSVVILAVGALLITSCASERSISSEAAAKGASYSKFVHFVSASSVKAEPVSAYEVSGQRAEMGGDYELVPDTYPLVPDYRLVEVPSVEYVLLAESYRLLPSSHELVGERYELLADAYELLPESYDLLR
ncbi:MAG: hypothetical protein ACJAYU_002985 [Bradymonadia bacterium]|jgi:hypothetical protein